MLKTIFFLLLKFIGGLVTIVLLIAAILFFRTKGERGYRVGWFGVSYFYKQSFDSWFYSKRKLKGEHKRSFEKVDGTYAKDKNRVYFQGFAMEDSDPESFSTAIISEEPAVLRKGFLVRDKNNVYYRKNLVSRDADNFRYIKGRYFRDNQSVFHVLPVVEPKYTNQFYFAPLEGVNALTFELLPESSALGRDDKNVFYENILVENANRENVEQWGSYWTDGYSIFFREHNLAGVDLSTFVSMDYPYSKDANQMYYKHLPLTGLNMDAFKELSEKGYITDEQLIFFEGKKLEGADYSSFTRIEFNYWKDKAQVYFQNIQLSGANPTTFEILKTSRGGSSRFSKDDKAVFFDGRKLEGVNPTTFVKKGKDPWRNDKWTDGKQKFNHLGEQL